MYAKTVDAGACLLGTTRRVLMMTMTPRKRIMSLVKGEPVDIIPWFPRIDLWYDYHKRQNTLPPEYSSLTMGEVIRKLGGGIFHRGVSIYRERLKNTQIRIHYSNPIWRERIENADKGLNRNHILALVLESVFSPESSVDIKFKKVATVEDREVSVQFETPHGNVSTKLISSEVLQEAGIRPVQCEYFIKDIQRDMEPVKYIIGSIELEPTFDHFAKIDRDVGEDGVTFARTSHYYSPMHQLMYVYMGLEQTCLALYDHLSKVEEILEYIEERLKRDQTICLDSPAHIIAHGGNFDSTVIGPRLFEKYFVPYFSKFAQKLHRRNKYLLIHTDGEMKNLMECFPRTNADIAEGFTPSPMTQVDFHDAVEMWGGKVIIWGGIPSSMLSRDIPEGEFYGYVKTLLEEGKGTPFVLGMGDNTPIDADITRLETVSEMVNRTPID